MDYPAGISVVIPTYRDDPALCSLLEKLSKFDIAEIIISDAEIRPRPDTLLGHAGNIPVTYLQASKGRGPQIASGLSASRQNIVWILHADSQPQFESPDAIRATLSAPHIALGCFPLAFSDSSIWLKLFSLFSHLDSPLTTFGDQGFFFRRSDYDALDLDLTDYPLLEDVALRKALKNRGDIRKLRFALKTSARRFRKHGYLRTQWRNLDILFRYWRGESPQALYRRYYDPTPQTAPTPPPSSTVHRV